MARRRSSKDKEQEQVEVLKSGEIPDADVDTTAADGTVKADATAKPSRTSPTADPPPEPKVYRVVRGGRILANGYRTTMRAGKEVDNLNYDIKRLQSQGIVLEEIKPEERTRPIGSTLDYT